MQEDIPKVEISSEAQKLLSTFKIGLEAVIKADGDHYAVLSFAHGMTVDRNSSQDDIKAAYKKLSKHCHPDFKRQELVDLKKQYPGLLTEFKEIEDLMNHAQSIITKAKEVLTGEGKEQYDNKYIPGRMAAVEAKSSEGLNTFGDFFAGFNEIARQQARMMQQAAADVRKTWDQAVAGNQALTGATMGGSYPIRPSRPNIPRNAEEDYPNQFTPERVAQLISDLKQTILDAPSLKRIVQYLQPNTIYDKHSPEKFCADFTITALLELVRVLSARISFKDNEAGFNVRLSDLPDNPIGNHIRKIATQEWQAQEKEWSIPSKRAK